jgi:uncharacterized protein
MQINCCTFDVHLKPRAKRDKVTYSDNGIIDIAVTSPPIDNKANEHLIRLLSDILKIPKSSIEIIRGGHSKNKAIAIENLSMDEVVKKFQNQK